jgi:uncharacterized PurR-regulated membrane protein YhhQ (DUF165 family)
MIMFRPSRRRDLVGGLAVAAYIGTIFAANWFIAHVGSQKFPGGPHTIPVGFGLDAPSGVLWVGVALTLRDVVQAALGRRLVVLAILVAAGLSYLVAPAFALASAVAFLVSELFDFAVYTPLAERGRWFAAVGASNTVGAVADSALFLALAFGSVALLPGQVLGKLWMTLAALPLLPVVRRRVVPWATAPARGVA